MLNDNEYKGILLDIGIKIGYYRRKSGMTQAELAENTGLTLSYISQLESPNLPYCPSIKSLFTIAKALGVKASKIIDIEEDWNIDDFGCFWREAKAFLRKVWFLYYAMRTNGNVSLRLIARVQLMAETEAWNLVPKRTLFHTMCNRLNVVL